MFIQPLLTDSSTNANRIMVKYNGVDDRWWWWPVGWKVVKKLKNCQELKNLGTTFVNAQDKHFNRLINQYVQVMIKYDEVDRGKSGAIGKLVKKSSKSRRIVKESKNFKGLKILQKPLV